MGNCCSSRHKVQKEVYAPSEASKQPRGKSARAAKSTKGASLEAPSTPLIVATDRPSNMGDQTEGFSDAGFESFLPGDQPEGDLSPQEGSPSFKKKKSAIPKHMASDFKRGKSNSTSSLYIANTISNPDNEEIVRCIAAALFAHLKSNEDNPNPKLFDVFSEKHHPLTSGHIDLDSLPSTRAIYKFIHTIFVSEQLAAECLILCLAYIERLISLSGLTLVASNWRRVALGGLILASKVWEDQAVWNVDFINMFPNITVHDLNMLERAYLELLQYNVSLKASLYAKYYFELRELSERDAKHFPLNPLNKYEAMRLEELSAQREKQTRRLSRSQSVDRFEKRPPPEILN